jgi:hypothetical protein
VNIHYHPVTLDSSHNGRDDDQCLLSHEVADASLLLLVLATKVRLDVELEGIGDANQQQQTEKSPHHGDLESHSCRPVCCSFV